MDNTEHLHSLVLDSSMELHLKNEFAVKVQGLDYEIMKSMIEIYEVTREIKSSNKAHFKLVPNKIGCKKIHHDWIGKSILRLIDNTTKIIIEIKEINEINPNVKLFVDAAKSESIIGCGCVVDSLIDDRAECVFRRLISFIKKIRDHDDCEINKQESNTYRASQKNHVSAIKYINKLFGVHSRILVVRIDLAYGEKDASYLSINDVKIHRDSLFRKMRKIKYFDAWIGYIWKLEYGVKKGYHYHMLFMFDGSKVRQDITTGLNIGQLWNDKITNAKGVYFNCNAYKYKYKHCGIGMINYHEKEKIEGLHKAISYLIKVDNFIKLKSKQIGRTFGRGRARS